MSSHLDPAMTLELLQRVFQGCGNGAVSAGHLHDPKYHPSGTNFHHKLKSLSLTTR